MDDVIRLVQKREIVFDEHILVGNVAAGSPDCWKYLSCDPFTKILRLWFVTSKNYIIKSAFANYRHFSALST